MSVGTKEKPTLLQKYNIQVDRLSYEYVEKCNDGKELERIVKILRSGEEGLYPQLIRCAEARLADIMPGSRELRIEEHMKRSRDNGYEFYMNAIDDIKEFRREMRMQDEELKIKQPRNIVTSLPPVRHPMKIQYSGSEHKQDEPKKLRSEPKKVKSTIPRNYSEWEKYDADRELLRMDIEEERKKERNEIKQKQKPVAKKKVEIARVNITDGAGDYEYTRAEKVLIASQQKDRGNEFFKAGEYKQAIEHYNAALVFDPTPMAYNNRAIAYIKLHRYAEALSDCNKVLEVEPNNVKALFRRGVAYQERNSFQKALDDFSKLAVLEPNNRLAQSLAQKMREQCDKLKKTVRMKIEEDSPTKRGNKVIKPWRSPVDRNIKYNEFGLPKVMCNCSGVPDWVRNPPPESYPDYSSDDDDPCEPTSASMEASETRHLSAPSVTNRLRDDSRLQCFGKPEKLLNVDDECETEKGSGDMNNKEKMASPVEESNTNMTSPPASVQTVKEKEVNSLQTENAKQVVRAQVESRETNCKEEPMQEIEDIGDLSLEDHTTSKITTAFEFISSWQGVKCRSDPLYFAPVLRRVDPEDLPSLIGNKLDGPMLSTILLCLEKAFLKDHSRVLGFLQKISSLERFTIVKCFLNPHDKEVIQRLFESLEKVGCHPLLDLQKAFL